MDGASNAGVHFDFTQQINSSEPPVPVRLELHMDHEPRRQMEKRECPRPACSARHVGALAALASPLPPFAGEVGFKLAYAKSESGAARTRDGSWRVTDQYCNKQPFGLLLG